MAGRRLRGVPAADHRRRRVGQDHTLAHRVAHLLVKGADPRRILLLTFSRRAAAEMTRRVDRISLASRRRRAAGALRPYWAGTFHGIGARLLREYAETIGLVAAFTIHDREDSADLMNLVRHELGFSEREALSGQEHLLRHLFARREWRTRRSPTCSASAFRGARMWQDELRALFAQYVEAKQQQSVLDYDDLLLYWSHLPPRPRSPAKSSARFDHVLVDEYQDTNSCRRRSCWR